MRFEEFLYDPGSGTPGSRVSSFPVRVDGAKTWQLEEDVRPDTGGGRGFFRPPDGHGIEMVVQGERTELNFVAPGYEATVPNGDDHWYGAVGQFRSPSNTSSWNLSGQWRWDSGGHPAVGMEIVNKRFFLDVRAYASSAIGQSARNYPAKPGVPIPFDIEIALVGHVKMNQGGGGLAHFEYAPAKLVGDVWKPSGPWVVLVDAPNIAAGYLSGAGAYFKLFFSHYSADHARRSSYLRIHAAARTRARLDALLGWTGSTVPPPVDPPPPPPPPPPPAGDDTDPVLSGLTVAYTAGATTIGFHAGASDNLGVKSVSFSLDGAPLATDVNPPYERPAHPLDAPLTAGDHILTATATDAAGNIVKASLPFKVAPWMPNPEPPPPPPPPVGDGCDEVRAMLESSQAENVVLSETLARANEQIVLARTDLIAIGNSARSKVTTLLSAKRRLTGISKRSMLGLEHLED